MINDALNLRYVIETYVSTSLASPDMLAKDKKKLKACQLTLEDWDELIDLHDLLYKFWELTLKMEGNVEAEMREDLRDGVAATVFDRPLNLFGKSTNDTVEDNDSAEGGEDGALYNVLPAFDSLLLKLETAKKKYLESDNCNFVTCVNLTWQKMDDYYKKSDDSKVYFVASILDPRIKLRYFEKHWPAHRLVNSQTKLDAYLKEFTTAMGIAAINPGDTESFNDGRNDSQNTETTFSSWRELDPDDDAMAVETEWHRYLGTGRVKVSKGFSVRKWWISHRAKFPLLFLVALETLAIPAMSTEVERVFSRYVSHTALLIIKRKTHFDTTS
jgi:hAT family C-terminal dimerisation region